jgi:uncharacterized protein YlxW (UPF0749 family)
MDGGNGDSTADGPGHRTSAVRRRPAGWRVGVITLLVVAGVLAASSAERRSGSGVTVTTHDSLADLVDTEQRDVGDAQAQQARLQAEVQAETGRQAATDSGVAQARQQGAALEDPAGLLPATGAAYTVSLDDAPKGAPVAAGYPAPTADDLVVHQQDVQAVVNALWAGGATAMTIMGKRLISTSAVRCVGNTLLLEGRVYSPPFVVTAIGDPKALAASVTAAPAVKIYQQYVAVYGLRFAAGDAGTVTLPGYDGAVTLTGVTAIPGAAR